ncbi:MAG TPA: DsbA family oxidoreductase [Steroidobacteraceae bacterium]|jgi:predicted DsbA family dithiol-disulfide isomerase|nr:DsbA family oxidoreductase [Steroidobacteraceae bacterium]
MNTPIRPLLDVRKTLDIDLVADFTCPWSWLGMAQLTRALGSLSGDVETRLRWHPFRMAPASAGKNPRSFHEYLAERLPAGISVPFAEKSLTEAGRELGIDFHFEKLGELPSTSEAHRLVQLAVSEGRHANVAAAIFRAYFERGADIGDVKVLAELGAQAGLSDKILQAFRETREGDTALIGSEERLRGFGVRTVPNLLFGGRVLVPGTVNVATYVHALDQALFPNDDEDSKEQPTLH